jgi:hypothetical protein
MNTVLARITDHGDYSAADEARLFALEAERQAERSDAIETDEAHIKACMAGTRVDRNRDGTTRCLDLRNEVLCHVAENYAGMDEAAKRYAAGDWQGFADQMRDVFDEAVRAVAIERLPYHLQAAS